MNKKYVAKSIPAILKAYLGFKTPLRVTHCITYRCNLNCPYCSRHGINVSEMTTKQVKGIMKSFRDSGCLFWSFNGGEPLLRDDLRELINYGKELGMYVSFATNGTLVADRIDEIEGVDIVSISLDGPPDVQNEARCGSYDKIVEGLDALKESGVRFCFTTVVGRHNLDSLGYMLDFAERYGTYVFFQPVRVQREDVKGKSRAYHPAKDQMQKAIDYLISEKSKGRAVASSMYFLQNIKSSWPDQKPNVKCWAGRIFSFVTPDGYVTACCDTLTFAYDTPGCNMVEYGTKAFKNVPRFNCQTCYSSMPLETNLLFSSFLRMPLLRRKKGVLYF